MSDTPETDKLFQRIWDSDKAEGFSYVVQAGHARKLERERDKAIKDRDDWMSQCEEAERKLTQARAIADKMADAIGDVLNGYNCDWKKQTLSEALAAYHVFTKQQTNTTNNP